MDTIHAASANVCTQINLDDQIVDDSCKAFDTQESRKEKKIRERETRAMYNRKLTTDQQ